MAGSADRYALVAMGRMGSNESLSVLADGWLAVASSMRSCLSSVSESVAMAVTGTALFDVGAAGGTTGVACGAGLE